MNNKLSYYDTIVILRCFYKKNTKLIDLVFILIHKFFLNKINI